MPFLASGITFVGYSPLGSPGRLEKERDDVNLLEVKVINDIAKAHDATPAQVWLVMSHLHVFYFIKMFCLLQCACL